MIRQIINLISLTATIVFILIVQKQLSNTTQHQNDTLRLVQAIAQGQTLTPSDHQLLKNITANFQSAQSSPLCFLKAYVEVVINNKLQPEDVFRLFEGKTEEYDGVQNCAQYYQVLLYRAQTLDKGEKVGGVIEKLWRQALGIDRNAQNNKICIYIQGWNAQNSIKWQINHLLGEKYTNYKAMIETDGNKDNTHILAKYTLEQQHTDHQNIIIHRNSAREGLIHNLALFLKENCTPNDIVLVINGKQKLIGHSTLEYTNQLFQQNTINFVHFQSISNYSNFITASNKKITMAPVFAFTHQFAKPLLDVLQQQSKVFNQPDLERELLFYYLLKKGTARDVKQAISFGGQSLTIKEIQQLTETLVSID